MRRHLGVVAVVADIHGGLAVPVDALNGFQDPVDEMFAQLLAGADNFDVGVLLRRVPGRRCVLQTLYQGLTFQVPGRSGFRGLSPRKIVSAASV